MKRNIAKLLGIGMVFIITIVGTSTARLFSQGEVESENGQVWKALATLNRVYLRRSGVEQQLLMARRATRNKGSKNWLLAPQVFGQLSAGGQQAVLRMNGIVPVAETSATAQIQQENPLPQIDNGDNLRVNDPGIDNLGRVQSESSIAVNGNNVIISFNDSGGVELQGNMLIANISGYAFSTNGGNTFTHKRIPLLPNSENGGDGVVEFGPNGEIYYAMLTLIGSKSIIGVAKSIDNGATFTTPVDASTTAGNTEDFQDKEWLTVDKGSSSSFKGNVYVSWTDFTNRGSFINFSRSTNNGTSFEPPITLSPKDDTFAVQGSMPVTAPNGDIYVFYLDSRSGIGINSVKSTDGGKTFTAPRKITTFIPIRPMTGGSGVRTNSFPSVAVDKNGSIHLTYAAVSPNAVGDRSDIFYILSTDGGNNFSTPRKLNDDGTTTAQFLPTIAATADGKVGVKWWDRRNDPINNSLTDVYMAISTNGGKTFGKNFRITNHNWVFGPNSLNSYHGDYDDIDTDGTDFYLCWSDERGLDPDVYFTKVPVSRDANQVDFNVSVKKPFDSVIAGSAAQFEFNTDSVNSFSGNVTLSATPAINGLSYNFDSAMVAVGQPARLTISTTAAVRPGTYLISVAATGSGLTRMTQLRLSIYGADRTIGLPVNATHSNGFSDAGSGNLQVDTKGTIHFTFNDDTATPRTGGIFYSQSVDGGKTYTNQVKVSKEGAFFINPTLTLDAVGNIYIVWSSLGSISFSKSMDGGKTFSAPLVVSLDTQFSLAPAIAIDKKGNILVTYDDVITGVLFALRSTDGGKTFSTPVQVSKNGENVSTGIVFNEANPVAFDSKGNAYIVYVVTDDDGFSNPVVKMVSFKNGKKFKLRKPKIIASERNSPHIAIDNEDNIYIAFIDINVGNVGIVKSINLGKLFSTETIIPAAENEFVIFAPYVILDAKGTVNIVWGQTQFRYDSTRNNGNSDDVFLARSMDGGKTFSQPINLSGNSGVSSLPSGGVNSNGKLFITWQDDSLANSELFVVSLPTIQQ
ncbi:MAG: hypothetical protein AB1489_29875 [Acidobacteriota bacterium]